MSRVDLHVHSNASDGRFSPAEVVQQAADKGLTVIALADHDSVDGIAPALRAAAAFPDLRVIPAVEISTDTAGGEVHVLGYFIDYHHPGLKAALENFRSSRLRRARQMVARLAELGMPIDWQRVQQIAGDGSIGRPHIAQALLEKGYISSLPEAFDKYLGHGKPAYVEREKMLPAAAAELIRRARGLPVLAHPLTSADPEAIVAALVPAGLVGIEAYCHGYSAEDTRRLVNLAARHGLIVTGGSDYHGHDDNSAEGMLGGVAVPDEAAEQLIALAQRRGLKPVNKASKEVL